MFKLITVRLSARHIGNNIYNYYLIKDLFLFKIVNNTCDLIFYIDSFIKDKNCDLYIGKYLITV